jgi:hypothetical protein
VVVGEVKEGGGASRASARLHKDNDQE